jgi:hypothetical protein
LGYVILGKDRDPYSREKPYIGSIQKGETFTKLTEVIKKL